jgi:RHS repeat-associated protein
VSVGGGDGHGPGSVELTLQAPTGERKTATTHSSEGKRVDFHVWVGEPVGCAEQAPGVQDPPSSCGLPVDLASGNVFFDQSDAAVAALGGDLHFVRSYNSVNRGDGLFGVFGRGWHHTYEQNLSFPEAGVIKLRRGNGRPIYFSDLDGDLRYDPTVPYRLESWIQKQPDGSYVRQMRKGGSETYDSSGRLLTLVDAFANTTVLGYNGSSQLTTITGPGGRALTLTYANGKIASLSGPAGTIATYTYDASDRLAGVEYADDAISGYTFTYDPSTGAITTVGDLTGRTLETHTYDGSGRGQTSEIAGGQERFTLTYLPSKTEVTTVDGTTTYDFDSFWGQQLVTKVTGSCDSCADGSETQQWTYDDKGRVASHTDAEGSVTTYTYDLATGDLLSATETKGPTTRTTTYTYDAAGRVLTVTASDRGTVVYTQSAAGPTSIQDAINRTTNLTYTTKGQLETVTNPRLKTRLLGYDASTGDLTSVTDPVQASTTFRYDALGRRDRVTDPLNNSTTYTYDARGHVTRITLPDTKFITFTYDKGGRRANVTDQLNRITTYGYDTFGRLATVTDASTPAGITRYAYDAMSRLTTITDARNKTTTFRHDTFGRVDQVTYPGTPTAVETFAYYATGRLKTRTDRKGVVTTYTYDDLGRLAQKAYSDGSPSVTYTYDLADRLKTAANSVDTLTWSYNLAGEMLSETSARNSSVVEYEYDGSGNRWKLKLNGTLVVSYGYDDADRLTSIVRGADRFTLAYDLASRRKELSFPTRVKTTYLYDVKSRLTELKTLNRQGSLLTKSTYDYDDVDNRVLKDGDFNETYTPDPLDRLTEVKRAGIISESYTYDEVGNRLSALNSSPWSYNDRNELGSYPGATFEYDPNGNTTQKVDGSLSWTYEWDVEDRLTRVLKNGSEVGRYAYDPIGRRAQKIDDGTTTTYLYDGEDILWQAAGTASVTYIHGPGIDEAFAREDPTGNRRYYHSDGLGSVVKETNSSGLVTLTRRYDAFGNLEPQFWTRDGYSFTGREWDMETGLYYYRARYYDPKIGRFLSEDPIGFDGGANFYAYVDNNPTNHTDPYGLFKWPAPPIVPPAVTGAGAAAAAGMAGVGVVVITLAYEYEQAQALARINAETAAANSNRCAQAQKKKNCWNIGSGGCTNNAGKPGAPPGLSKRCNYACDDGTSYIRYVPCKWKGDDPPCPAP